MGQIAPQGGRIGPPRHMGPQRTSKNMIFISFVQLSREAENTSGRNISGSHSRKKGPGPKAEKRNGATSRKRTGVPMGLQFFFRLLAPVLFSAFGPGSFSLHPKCKVLVFFARLRPPRPPALLRSLAPPPPSPHHHRGHAHLVVLA